MVAESRPRRRLFITGGSGALGHALIPYLVNEGMVVRALCHRRAVEGPGVEAVWGDLRAFDDHWLEDIDAVIHLAAQAIPTAERQAMMRNNVETAAGLVEALKRHGGQLPLVFTSSIAVHGPNRNGAPHEAQSASEPCTDYGRAKLAAERIIGEYPQAIIVRLPMVVGAGRALDVFRKLARWRIFPLAPGRFSAIDVRDVNRLLFQLAVASSADERLYEASDREIYGWRTVADCLEEETKIKLMRLPIPPFVLWPSLTGLIGNTDGAYYLKYDWFCRPNFPEGFDVEFPAFKGKSL
ncbi:MAG TPA: NAD-dependent epimerase/dehydratase family protein [bacterium]|nr:NAD-dependent epimerase/dehydratase family protein [bacterium]